MTNVANIWRTQHQRLNTFLGLKREVAKLWISGKYLCRSLMKYNVFQKTTKIKPNFISLSCLDLPLVTFEQCLPAINELKLRYIEASEHQRILSLVLKKGFKIRIRTCQSLDNFTCQKRKRRFMLHSNVKRLARGSI